MRLGALTPVGELQQYRNSSVCGLPIWVVWDFIISQGASLVVQTVKNPPVMQETQVQSLGWEVTVERGMATTPVYSLGEFQRQRSLAGYSSCWWQRVGHNWVINTISQECPLLLSCLWMSLAVEYLFLVGSSLSYCDCSAISCDFGVLMRVGEFKVLILCHLVSLPSPMTESWITEQGDTRQKYLY